jgi:hypothetical protein
VSHLAVFALLLSGAMRAHNEWQPSTAHHLKPLKVREGNY